MKLSNLLRVMLVLLCFALASSEIPRSIRPGSRSFAESVRVTPACDRYPRVCRAKGSPGPDCCGKWCVDVAADRLNCGACGKRCRYGEMCCQGSCVNPLVDGKHCGRCGNKCSKGSYCVYGLCNYA